MVTQSSTMLKIASPRLYSCCHGDSSDANIENKNSDYLFTFSFNHQIYVKCFSQALKIASKWSVIEKCDLHDELTGI